jgi:uncharacterized protein
MIAVKRIGFVLLLLMAVVAAPGAPLFAEDAPSLHQIYQAAQGGRLDEALSMTDKVLQLHPQSGKAHFVRAELLAKQGHLVAAKTELDLAGRLAPGLPFAKPAAVQALRSRVSGAAGGADPTTGLLPHISGGIPPWGLLLLGAGAVLVVLLVVRAFRSPPAVVPPMGRYAGGSTPGATPYPTSGAAPYPSGGAAPMGTPGGGIGSGILGGLATGVAVGGGLVAGEALAHHFLDGNQTAAAASPPPASAPQPDASSYAADDMGGADFGIADNSSWDSDGGLSGLDGGGDDWS